MNSKFSINSLWLGLIIVFCSQTAGGQPNSSSSETLSKGPNHIQEVNTLSTRADWIQFLSKYTLNDIDNDYLSNHADWVEKNYSKYHQINGVSYMTGFDSTLNTPSYHFSVDAAIYSGYYTAAAVLRAIEEPTPGNMDSLFNSLRGLYVLTHSSGVAGLTSKAIIPMSGLIDEFGLPKYWFAHLKEKQAQYQKRQLQIKRNIDWNKNNSAFNQKRPVSHQDLMKLTEFSDPQPPALSSPEVPNEIHWRERIITAGQSYIGPDNLIDPLYFMDISKEQLRLPQVLTYQRTTKDQLTGVLLALAVAIKYLDADTYPDQYKKQIKNSRELCKLIAWNVYHRLRRHNYVLKDQNGITKTSSHNVSGLLRINLLLLAKTVASENKLHTHKIFPKEDWAQQEKNINQQLEKEYKGTFGMYFLGCQGISSLENSVLRYKNYYKWNLRFTRIYAAILLEQNPERSRCYDKHMRKGLWPNIKDQRNSMFNFIYNLTKRDGDEIAQVDTDSMSEGLSSLKSLSVRPLRDWSSPDHELHGDRSNSLWEDFTNHIPRILDPHKRAFWGMFIWASEPFYYAYDYQRGPVKEIATSEAPGLDYLFGYWLGRFYYPEYFLTSTPKINYVSAIEHGLSRRQVLIK